MTDYTELLKRLDQTAENGLPKSAFGIDPTYSTAAAAIRELQAEADTAYTRGLEDAAKDCEPKNKMPCDCVEQLPNGAWVQSCSCHNEGDVANVSYWCSAKNIAKEIRALKPKE